LDEIESTRLEGRLGRRADAGPWTVRELCWRRRVVFWLIGSACGLVPMRISRSHGLAARVGSLLESSSTPSAPFSYGPCRLLLIPIGCGSCRRAGSERCRVDLLRIPIAVPPPIVSDPDGCYVRGEPVGGY